MAKGKAWETKETKDRGRRDTAHRPSQGTKTGEKKRKEGKGASSQKGGFTRVVIFFSDPVEYQSMQIINQ